MEDEMNPIESSFTIDQIVQLIETLYNSNDPSKQAVADKQLTKLQSSERIWEICWALLDPNQSRFSDQVYFFASNALVQMINKSWGQHDEEWLEKQLRPKLFEVLVNHTSLNQTNSLVVGRLSLALATFALHSIPTFWPDAIKDILHFFTQQNLHVNVSSNPWNCKILLKILMYIPEEYSVLLPKENHRAKLNCEITKSGPIVFNYLRSLLIAERGLFPVDCVLSILNCITSWTEHSKTSLLELEEGKSLLDLIYESIKNEELCGSACAALAATFSSQKAEKYQNSVIDFIPRIASLKQFIDFYNDCDEIECVIKIYSLVTNFAENNARLLLKIVLNDGIQLEPNRSEVTKQSIFGILRIILDCSSAPGGYGVDEKYSCIALPFWFTFFENFYYYADTFNDLICGTFDPLVDSLLQTLIKKSSYPPTAIYYQSWNDDQRETFRCYRHDLGDNISLIVQFPRSRERILAQLHDLLSQELDMLVNPTSETPWQGFESIVFALKSISDSVPYDEAKYVPQVFSVLSQVQFDESHTLLYCTIAEMISAYSDWLYSHNTHLAIAFNILFLGVNSSNSHVRLMSTLSLKDLTNECQVVLQPFAAQIVTSCTSAILQPNSSLETNEKARLMHTIGTTLAMSPPETISSSFNNLALLLVNDLQSKAQADPNSDLTSRPTIIDRLTMLNSLIESLYIKPHSGNSYEYEDENDPRTMDPSRFESVQENDAIIQPSIELLRKLIPILTVVSNRYRSDEDVMGIISDTIKRSAKSLGIELQPILKDFLSIVVHAYDPITNSIILEGALPLYMLFKVDENVHPLLKDAFYQISDKTLEVCMKIPLHQLSMTIENYFRYATFVCKKFQDFFTLPASNANVEYIYKLAIASLELPEKRTLTEVSNFLGQFVQKSLGVDYLRKILVSHLDVLLCNIFNIFGGNYSTPRNAIDNITDLLYLVLEAEESKGPLNQIIAKENFPTSFVSRDEKARFVSKIVHERNRKKLKDACSMFVLTARNLTRQF